MKRAIAIVLAIMSITALCAPVRSMLGAQGAINKTTATETWNNPYITDGLIAMWDGEWNAGPGKHDPNAKVWKDISHHNFDLNVMAGVFGDNYIDCSYGTSSSPTAQSTTINIPNPKHIEVVAVDTSVTSDTSILTTGKNWGIVKGDSYSRRTLTPCFGKTVLNICKRFPDYVYFQGQTFSYDYTGPIGYINGEIITFPSDHNPSSIYISRAGFTCIGCQRNYASDGYKNIFKGSVYTIRIYSRSLTADEVMHNYMVDKERFGL